MDDDPTAHMRPRGKDLLRLGDVLQRKSARQQWPQLAILDLVDDRLRVDRGTHRDAVKAQLLQVKLAPVHQHHRAGHGARRDVTPAGMQQVQALGNLIPGHDISHHVKLGGGSESTQRGWVVGLFARDDGVHSQRLDGGYLSAVTASQARHHAVMVSIGRVMRVIEAATKPLTARQLEAQHGGAAKPLRLANQRLREKRLHDQPPAATTVAA